jgi:hypothetical protein
VLNRVYEDVASGKDANRLELVAARHALASGLVGGLVVTRLDRLSRSIADFPLPPGLLHCPIAGRALAGGSFEPADQMALARSANAMASRRRGGSLAATS